MIAGHYRLVEHVGSGAMGVVWRAVDERLERSVAVKHILTQPGLSESERDNVRQRAMREAKNAARFQHPNAIVVFDIAEHAGEPCLVMEYLPSRSLSTVLAERGTLAVGEVARIGEQVASALVAAHRAGIVHRDIKPGNILIDDNGTVKITDFGISRATGDLTLTQTGLIGGTPAYLAPELARGADPTPSSDVFALGATLYHAIEGLTPYGGNTNQLALLYAAANGNIKPPTHAGPATALLMSLLRPEPTERPSMGEARERLAKLAAESNGKPMAATMVSPPLPHGGGRKPAAVPPWQRDEARQPRTPTSNLPVTAPPRPAPQRGGPRGGSRKPVLLGALGAAVLIAAAVLVIVLNSAGDDQNPGAGGQQEQQSSAPQNPSSPAAPAQLGETEHTGGTVDWTPAGERVIEFYTVKGTPAGWSMLTDAAKSVYGSQDEFAAYWAKHEDVYARRARAPGGNNPDGSVDIQAEVDSEEMTFRVIEVGGQLLIDSNTKVPD